MNSLPTYDELIVHAKEAIDNAEYDKAVKYAKKAIKKNDKKIEAYFVCEAAHEKLQQYSAAIENYNKVTEIDPDDISAYKARGDIYYFNLNDHTNRQHS